MPDRLIDALSTIAREAGELALRRSGETYGRWEKSPGNPVCEIDLQVNELLHKRLSALDPEAGWLSEETADNRDRLDKARVWVVDPIDGTRDYVRGRAGWAISVALVEHGRPVIGVLNAPARGEHWEAVLGGGARRNGIALSVSAHSELAGARIPSDKLAGRNAHLTAVHRPNGIALQMAMVAADEADMAASLRWGNEWDIAAAALIVTEAGGKVTDALGNALSFNADPPRAFGVLAAAPGIHSAAVRHLQAQAAELAARSRSSGSGSSRP